MTLSTGRSVFNSFDDIIGAETRAGGAAGGGGRDSLDAFDAVVAQAGPQGSTAHPAAGSGVGEAPLERIQASLDLQHAEHAIQVRPSMMGGKGLGKPTPPARMYVQMHMAELAIRLEDLDSRVAVTGSMLALLDSQQAVLKQQLASATSESAEEEWCRRALLACEAKQLQVSALLARQSLLARPQQLLSLSHFVCNALYCRGTLRWRPSDRPRRR